MGKQWINAKFGDKWIEHAKEHYDFDVVCRIALKNGRKSIVLQEVVDEFLKKYPNIELKNKLDIILKELDEL